jgi:hypothetical protein
MQDGDAIAPHKRAHPFLQDDTQAIKETINAPAVQSYKPTFQEIKDAYLLESLSNENAARLFPIENNIRGEDGQQGFRYLLFPCLNERLYKHKDVLGHTLAQNLESKYQTKYRTESRVAAGQRSMFTRHKITIPQVSRTMGTYVYITWIYIWCGTLWM